MVNEELFIKEIEQKLTKRDNKPFWIIQTNLGEYTCFKDNVIEQIRANVGKTVSVDTQKSGEYNNILSFDKVAETQAPPVGAAAPAAPVEKDNERLASMLTSYAKDLVIPSDPTMKEYKAAMFAAAIAVLEAYKEIKKGL